MVRKFLKLDDDDLKNNPHKYDEEQLIYTLQTYCPSLRILNRYQTLSAYICSKYVIFGGNNEKYGDCSEDRWLDDNNILSCQKHLTQQDLCYAHYFVENEEESECEELKMMSENDIIFQF